MIRYKYNPDAEPCITPIPELGDKIHMGDEIGTVVGLPTMIPITVRVEFRYIEALIPINKIEVLDVYNKLRRYRYKHVQQFLHNLCGPQEPSSNCAHLQINTRQNEVTQFIYCLLESHASVGTPVVHSLIEKFEQLGAWEKANVMFALADVISRRVTHAAYYWANIARHLEEEDAHWANKTPQIEEKDKDNG